ncbi:hypothetical protein T484DRAFT_1953072 [Baffinella frigidus]|nr:hypothetical protein T484DRAFT_1953072 [Cryptophyta sp. CCMP2293]
MLLRPLASRLAGSLRHRGFHVSAVALTKPDPPDDITISVVERSGRRAKPPGLTISVVERWDDGETTRKQQLLPVRPPLAFEKTMMLGRIAMKDEHFARDSTRAKLTEVHDAERQRLLATPDDVSDETWTALCDANGLRKSRFGRGPLAIKQTVLEWFRAFDSLDSKTLDELRLIPEQLMLKAAIKRLPDVSLQALVSVQKGQVANNGRCGSYLSTPPDEKMEAAKIVATRKMLRERLVADVDTHVRLAADAAEGRKRKEQQDLVAGKFYASPAPSGRSKCTSCREVIPKGALRVSEHYLLTEGGPGGRMHARASHMHAVCYCAYHHAAPSDVAWSKDMAYGSGLLAATGEDLAPLRDALMFDNAEAMKDRKWKKQQFAPVVLEHPADTVTFDDDHFGNYGAEHSTLLDTVGPGRIELRTAPKNPKDNSFPGD